MEVLTKAEREKNESVMPNVENMSPIKVRARKVSCCECNLAAGCLPAAISEGQLDKLDGIIRRGHSLRKGEFLFSMGDVFESIHVVRSGSIMTFTVSENGEVQVTGFYLPGDILGIDGISNAVHSNYAKSLETAHVCTVPFNQFESLVTHIPSLQHLFFMKMSQEIQNKQKLFMQISKRSAVERISTFLLDMSVRNENRGLSGSCFRLPMSRADIGNFLGLALETASRSFTRLQKQRVISATGKDIEIINAVLLLAISNGGFERSLLETA